MLMLLPESAARVRVRPGGSLLSVAVHASLIGAVIVATVQSEGVAVPDAQPLIERYVEVQQAPPPASQPAATTASHNASPTVQVPVFTIPSIDLPSNLSLTLPVASRDFAIDLVASTRRGGTTYGVPGGTQGTSGTVTSVFSADQVDKAVLLRPGAQLPRYPELLRSAGIEGQVVVRFVVDTNGHPVLATLEVLESDHALFAAAVREAFVHYRFLPAEVGGRKVQQSVLLPFRFTTREPR